MIIIRRIYYIRWAIISPGLRELCHRLWANPTYDCGDTWGSKAPPTRYTFQCLSVTAKVSCYTQLITVIITVNLYSAFLQETSNALKGVGWLKVTCLRWRMKVGSDWDSRIPTSNEFQTLGAENRKARDPSVSIPFCSSPTATTDFLSYESTWRCCLSMSTMPWLIILIFLTQVGLLDLPWWWSQLPVSYYVQYNVSQVSELVSFDLVHYIPTFASMVHTSSLAFLPVHGISLSLSSSQSAR